MPRLRYTPLMHLTLIMTLSSLFERGEGQNEVKAPCIVDDRRTPNLIFVYSVINGKKAKGPLLSSYIMDGKPHLS